MREGRKRSFESLAGERVVRRIRARSWPVRAIGVLLVAQAASLCVPIFRQASLVVWSNVRMRGAVPEGLPEAGYVTVFFGAPAALAVLAALVFFVLYRRGWLLAMMVQSLTLLACLGLYFRDDPAYIYPIMVYSVLMVLFLNSSEVRVMLHSREDGR